MLTVALMEQAPGDVRVGREMTIKLDARNRPEPDLLLTTADYDGDRTWFAPDAVVHVYELDEPTGAYAPAGIFRSALKRPVPFEISLDLDKLTPPRGD